MATSFSGGRSRSTRREPPTMGQATGKLDHLRLRFECTLFCNLHYVCDKVCQWLTAGRWFSLWILLFPSTNKTDRHDITEILLKVTLNTLNHWVYNFWLIHHETVKYIACEKDYFVPVDAIFQSFLIVSC